MKKLTMLLSLLCLTAALAVPASALEYVTASPSVPGRSGRTWDGW